MKLSSSKTLRLLILALLSVVLVAVVARRSVEREQNEDGSYDPPCFASKLGLPCR